MLTMKIQEKLPFDTSSVKAANAGLTGLLQSAREKPHFTYSPRIYKRLSLYEKHVALAASAFSVSR